MTKGTALSIYFKETSSFFLKKIVHFRLMFIILTHLLRAKLMSEGEERQLDVGKWHACVARDWCSGPTAS